MRIYMTLYNMIKLPCCDCNIDIVIIFLVHSSKAMISCGWIMTNFRSNSKGLEQKILFLMRQIEISDKELF